MNIQGTTYKEIGEQYLKIGGIPKELIQDLAEARQELKNLKFAIAYVGATILIEEYMRKELRK